MPATVLMVDDDSALLDAVARTLRREPYRLLFADQAEQALRLLEQNPVDVIVSDDQMPGMTGLDLLTQVRQRYPDVVAVMMSGQASIGTVVRALNDGCIFRFLIKPSSPDELRASIAQALDQKQLMDACRLLLPLFRRQASLLAAIDQHHPGLIRSLEPGVTTVIATRKREDAATAGELVTRMDAEIRRAEGLHGTATR